MTDNRRRSKSRNRHSKVLAPIAIRVARKALCELDEGPIGEHIGVGVVNHGVAVHRFEADLPGYRGWEWQVVVACAPGSSHVTVSEIALVPGESALQAPEWVPYEDRVRPGDLGPRDLMPAASDDPRLDGEDIEHRQLSQYGLDSTAHRWKEGDTGPDSVFANEALKPCHTCAFFVALTGALGKKWGACVNEWAFDGSVVNANYGCGAHSAIPEVSGQGVPVDEPYDDQAIIE